MNEAEAQTRAKELNAQLGLAGERHAFFVEVEIAPGDWDVALGGEPTRHGRLSVIWEGFVQAVDHNPPGTYGL